MKISASTVVFGLCVTGLGLASPTVPSEDVRLVFLGLEGGRWDEFTARVKAELQDPSTEEP